MRTLPLAIVVIAAISSLRCSVAHTEVPQHTQKAPKEWTPPSTDLPQKWIETTKFLHAHGLGDPRGGDYRKAKILLGSVWQTDRILSEENGWLMPDKTFIAWDGLAYKPESVGGKADLEKDVREALKGAKTPQMFLGRGRDAKPNSLIGTCLLLVAGRADLAERVASAIDPHQNGDFLVNAGVQFMAGWFERAVTAHMRGNDLLAADDAAGILAVRADYDALIKAGSIDEMNKPFAFLDPSKTLLEDSDRRLAEGTKPKPDNRIAALIQDLDKVSARQMGQPGGVLLAQDPVVADLIKEGPPAVEPLLDCMEKDTRLTRSVSFHRDFFPSRNLITVKSAAMAAFRGIVDSYDFRDGAFQDPSVAQLRTWWDQNKSLSGPERWMAVLQDDNANYQRWEEAAGRLTEDVSIQHLGQGAYMGKPGDPPKQMKGEPARDKTNPSVTDLLSKRAIQLAGTGEVTNSGDLFKAAVGARMAKMLGRWDPAHALPTIQKVSERSYELLTTGPMKGNGNSSLGQHYALLENARLDLHDTSGLDKYANWLAQTNPSDLFGFDLQIVAPFWNHPNDPAILKPFQTIFLSDTSKWSIGKGGVNPSAASYLQSVTATQMIAVPQFRELLVRLLDDERTVGQAWADRGSARFEIPTGASGGMAYRVKRNPDPLANDTSRKPYRVCDMMACSLSVLTSSPEFAPYWPQAKRDQVIAQMKNVLLTKGEALAKDAPPVFSWF